MIPAIDILFILATVIISVSIIMMAIVKDVLVLTFLTTLISLFSTILYVLVDAVDVAFTEAAVGACISTLLALYIIFLTKSYSILNKKKQDTSYKSSGLKLLYIIFLCFTVFIMFAEIILYVPEFGSIYNPAHNGLYHFFVTESYETYHVQNIVTMVLGSFRAYDTMGEVFVILIGAFGVMVVLKSTKEDSLYSTSISKITTNIGENVQDSPAIKVEPSISYSTKDQKPKKSKISTTRDFVLSSAMFSLIPILSIFAFYVQFHGDFGPGGGFQAGVILAAVYIIITLVVGNYISRKIIPSFFLKKLLPIGALLYLSVGFLSLIMGEHFLDYIVFGYDIGHSYHYGLFLIELGVGITVFAAVSLIISQFAKKINTFRYKKR